MTTQTINFPPVPLAGQWRWVVEETSIPDMARLRLQRKGRFFWWTQFSAAVCPFGSYTMKEQIERDAMFVLDRALTAQGKSASTYKGVYPA